MGVRPYSDTDMPRLQDTVAGWIAEAGSCGYDHIGELPHRIYEDLPGRRPVGDLVQLWDDTDGLAGLAINLRMGVACEPEREMLRAAFGTTARLMSGSADWPGP